MALRLFLVFVVISVALIVPGHATQSPAEVYWKTKLGNIPMPKVVKECLQPGVLDNSITTGYAQGLPTTTTSMSNKNCQLDADFVRRYSYLPTKTVGTTSMSKKNYQLDADFVRRYSYLPTKTVGTTSMSEKNYQLDADFVRRYSYLPTKTVGTIHADHTIHEGLLDDNSVIFFSEKDLINPRGEMKLHFISSNDGVKFLPLEVAKSIPFSSEKLPEILNLLSVKPESASAKKMEDTIRICEGRTIKGEEKHCTTSLEAIVDYAISKVGNNIMTYSTEVDKDTTMQYRVERAQKITSKDVNLVCHKLSYPYAVFYCHNQKKSDIYVVSLVGANGKKTKAVAVCHRDTSSWNPRHLAFQLLKVKPGSMPICHFLNEMTIVWVPK